MHEYQRKSFTAEQENQLRASAGKSVYISNFLTQEEFDFCRRLVMRPIDWPEHGKVSKSVSYTHLTLPTIYSV